MRSVKNPDLRLKKSDKPETLEAHRTVIARVPNVTP